VDEDGEWGTVAVGFGVLPPSHLRFHQQHSNDLLQMMRFSRWNRPSSALRSGATSIDITSPNKKPRLDEDDLTLMDSANDRLEDDVIEID